MFIRHRQKESRNSLISNNQIKSHEKVNTANHRDHFIGIGNLHSG
jgi:hypothetical protein